MSAPAILLVDNEPLVRSVLAEVLRAEGFDVVVAASGIEALGAVRRKRPDVVLLDVQMPGMDGWETLEALREIGLPRIVMMSGMDVREVAIMRGADGFVSKPYRATEVVLAVRAALDATPTG